MLENDWFCENIILARFVKKRRCYAWIAHLDGALRLSTCVCIYEYEKSEKKVLG